MSSPEHNADFELIIRPVSAISLRDAAEVWRYRELLWTLAMRDISVRYKQAAMGVAWALLQPVAQMLIFTVLFNRLAGIRADVDVPYPLFCLTGLVVWTLFASGLSQASESLVNNANVITKVYFPRVVVPMASIVAACADFVVAFALLLVLLPFFHIGYRPSLLLAPPIAALGALCAAAGGLWLSAINLQFRDVRYALPFFIQLLIFLTPVFYSSSLIPAKYRVLLALNPMCAVIDGFRAAVLGGPLPWARLGLALAGITVVGAVGFLSFRRMEHNFADRV
jgi:lipopolysaccharide transport system permease protein